LQEVSRAALQPVNNRTTTIAAPGIPGFDNIHMSYPYAASNNLGLPRLAPSFPLELHASRKLAG
jgi:hypothetical protein